MTQNLVILVVSTFFVGVIHTLIGPDHYIPFVVLAKSRKWSLLKTAIITAACGVGHVLSAMILGAIAVLFAVTLNRVNCFEAFRSDISAWILIGCGFAYFLWGMRRVFKNRKHEHFHLHGDGVAHVHGHGHNDEHAHIHAKKSLKELTPWVLFVVFILGPCEPLIPLLMYPAIQKSVVNVFLVAGVFCVATLAVMLFMVFVLVYSVGKVKRFTVCEQYGAAFAGIVICCCGFLIKFGG